MAKVGTVQFKIEGKYINCDLTYSRKNGFSLLHFPHRLFEVTGHHFGQWFHTENDLLAAYRELIDKYHEAIVNLKKVILYSLYLPTGKRMNKVGRGHYVGAASWLTQELAYKIEDCGTHDSFGFCIDYRVVYRQDKNGVTYYDLDKGVEDEEVQGRPTSKKHKEFEMDWTADRELFFISLEKSADEMVKKVMTFFGQEETKLLQIIDSKIKLLQ